MAEMVTTGLETFSSSAASRIAELERRLEAERARARRFRDGQRLFFEQLIAGCPLGVVLDELVRLVEGDMEGALGSILLLDADGKHLLHGAAPSLPEAYNASVHKLPIGPASGSCGAAASLNCVVISGDIETDPLWASGRALALAHGLRACWSVPFHDGTGKVLGTFAFYFRTPRAPRPDDIMQIRGMAHLAAVAVEHLRRAEDAVRQERRLAQAKASAL
jgi:GAF domain-containing protein